MAADERLVIFASSLGTVFSGMIFISTAPSASF